MFLKNTKKALPESLPIKTGLTTKVSLSIKSNVTKVTKPKNIFAKKKTNFIVVVISKGQATLTYRNN